MATATRQAAPDVARFKQCKGRITDFFEGSADAVREKRTLMATAAVLGEMKFLADEAVRLGGLDALQGADLDRFSRIEKFVTRACEDHAGAIKTGQFIKVRADAFSAYRFLVRALETTLKRVLDVEDQFALGKRLTPEHEERVVLDLEEGLGDEE